MRKILLQCLSFFFFGVGLIGVIVPLLPTTPFLLLASFFAMKSSVRFNQWLTHTKLYQKHVNDFVTTKTMTRASKVRILALATIMLSIGFVMSRNNAARIVIVILMIIKYYYFLVRIPTRINLTNTEESHD